jgi:uncharacterized protein with PIN domain
MSAKLRSAVVDSSALMCIARNEAASDLFLQELGQVDALFINAATHSEVQLAAMAIQEPGAADAMEKLISALRITTVDYTSADVQAYKKAAAVYHVKAKPPGPLNMGDLFSFQVSQKMDFPLFSQGLDFLQTPVKNAMTICGYITNMQNKGVPTVPLSRQNQV